MSTTDATATTSAHATARVQSRAEEAANAASHALALALPVVAWPHLAAAAHSEGDAIAVAGVAVFCITMGLCFAASAVCHALPPGRAKLWARAVDHAAIFLFIAGSATPFMLGAMPRPAGLFTCALVWLLALAGASLKLMRRLTNRRLSTGLYVLLGWCALLAIAPGTLDGDALGWLLAGGFAYLVGTGFFVYDARLRFGHFVWHVCVVAGSACHLVAAVS